ncbi:dephospho-CoA kinase [Aerococcaceae bacterium DSM 111020]|nr:dephospho-CoA kinase [Aerococcaceae bacterium DSM 111020]
MTVIIITGSIATGKSTATHYLEQQGYPVIDTDVISRQVVTPGHVGLERIVDTFGEGVLLEDGQLNREALGAIIFNDSTAREQLNQLLHPLIFAEAQKQIERTQQAGQQIIFVDIPLFFEVGTDIKYDAVWLVSIPEDLQLKRLMARNQLSKADASARIKSQIPIQEKEQKADVVLNNSRDRDWLYRQIDLEMNRLKGHNR